MENSAFGQKKQRLLKILAVIGAFVALLFIIMQLAYFHYNEKSHYEYIADWMFYAVNGVILVCMSFPAAYALRFSKTGTYAVIILISAVFCVNLVFMFINGWATVSIVSISSDLKYEMVLKQDPETGKVNVYRNPLLIFARRYEPLSYSVDGDIKLQWLASGVCAATCMDTDQHLRQYVGTFGDRGDGISYYTVINAIRGSWALDAIHNDGQKITVDGGKITITNGDSSETFDQSNCEQFGTLALVLYRDGRPRWTIALNGDCTLNDLNIIEDGGTITLCEVSMDKTAALTYFRTDSPLKDYTAPTPMPTAAPTEPLPSDFDDLAAYSPLSGITDVVYKLETGSTDMFEIGKLALAEDRKHFGPESSKYDMQVTQLRLLAGDISEFLIAVDAACTEDNLGVTSTFDYNKIFRIRKGDGVYGVVSVGENDNAYEGLGKIDPPQIENTANDPDYYIFVPARLSGAMEYESENEGAKVAEEMASILKRSPDLSGFQSEQGRVSFKTDATDPFVIARIASEENDKLFAINGYNRDAQITKMRLLAGDADEFLIELEISEVITAEGTNEKTGHNPTYRIKRGDGGAFLVMQITYGIDGSSGLTVLNPPQVKDTADNPDYHYYVPAA